MEKDETTMDNVEEQTDIQGDFQVGQDEEGTEDTASIGVRKGYSDTEVSSEKEDVVPSISDRLSEKESGSVKQGVVNPEQAIPFDITKLSREQMQTLKSMLNATPDAQTRKRENPRIKLRSIDGKIIIDFKRAFNTTLKDPELNRDVERHVIPVRFQGDPEEKYENILYSRFINSDQIVCEIVDSRQKVEEFIEGETFSRETGTMVEMVRKEIKQWYTVKLPNGDTLEIEGRLSNA